MISQIYRHGKCEKCVPHKLNQLQYFCAHGTWHTSSERWKSLGCIERIEKEYEQLKSFERLPRYKNVLSWVQSSIQSKEVHTLFSFDVISFQGMSTNSLTTDNIPILFLLWTKKGQLNHSMKCDERIIVSISFGVLWIRNLWRVLASNVEIRETEHPPTQLPLYASKAILILIRVCMLYVLSFLVFIVVTGRCESSW